MKAVVVAVTFACGCFAMSPVMQFGGGKSSQEVQKSEATRLTPPALVTTDEGWSGDLVTAKIRVWADDDYRAQNIRWQRSFDEQLAYANELLGPLLGVRLQAEYREWDYHSAGATLAERLAVLASLDPGTDVLTVVGLTSSLSLVSATFEQLGYASVPGRHLILRGYADVFERQAFDRAFRDLRPEERDALYHARRRHKTTTLLLHELGHNLSAGHEAEPHTIMNALYSDDSASFTSNSRDAMLATIDQRLNRKRTTPAARPAELHPTLVITVNAAHETVVGGQTIDDATLDGLLRLSLADDPETEVIVRATRGVPHGAVVKILERAKAVGLRRMSVATDPAQP